MKPTDITIEILKSIRDELHDGLSSVREGVSGVRLGEKANATPFTSRNVTSTAETSRGAPRQRRTSARIPVGVAS